MLVRKTKYQKLSRVQFAPDGCGLVAAGKYGAYWWPSVFDHEKAVLFGVEECCGAGFTPDGAYLVAAVVQGFRQTDLLAVNTATRERRSVRIERDDCLSLSFAVCPTTGLAVLECYSGGEMSGWHVGPDGTLVQTWAKEAEPGSIGSTVAFGPDGKWFARAIRDEEPSRNYLFALHDPATGAELRICDGGEWVSAGPAVSPDAEWIAFGFANRLCAQSTTGPKQKKYAVNDNTHQFTGLAYHPSGDFLAVTNNDETVQLYDARTWKPVRTFTWDIGRMRSVCFSPDGTVAAAGSDKGKVIVWDVDI